MARSPSSLAELQARMQAAILAESPADEDLTLIAEPAGNTPGERLETYRSAYRIRLVSILRDEFDALHAFLGDEEFDALALAYVAACPSSTPDARWYGARFAGFALSTGPWSDHPVIGELAALQWALSGAFDAADAPVMQIEDLAAIPADGVASLRLAFHPSTSLLERRTNASEIFTGLRSEAEPVAPDAIADGSAVLVWRSDNRARYRILEAEEAMLAREAMGGQDFSLLCEMAATMADPDSAAMRVAGVLRSWIDGSVLSGVQPSACVSPGPSIRP